MYSELPFWLIMYVLGNKHWLRKNHFRLSNISFHWKNSIWNKFCTFSTYRNDHAAAKPLQLCLTLCDPVDRSHQAPLSLGFSRQEHWSGLPFTSPMQESVKWKWSRSVMSDSSRPHGLQPIRLLHPWDFPGKSTGVGCHCLLWEMTIGG